jgi:hypothetical protein
MTQCIIYIQDDGIPAIIAPTQEALARYTIQEIAAKDVPHGKHFIIADSSELPNFPQETWVIDPIELENLADGIGGESNEFDH